MQRDKISGPAVSWMSPMGYWERMSCIIHEEDFGNIKEDGAMTRWRDATVAVAREKYGR